ncbi:transcriptional repressor LexA [Brachyspira hyodysenteriae]|uniref:LexA repressor n=1 Tax=Brachyspira hyodysenteriae (strain ATCC 49526 / WA1) TaxID=565034 RepID=A0A3B6V8H0_BRAHW|nr:transcriptional repressor LexA [Brachyspira hyodysenteriae]ACN83122.1 LexA repressor [Brachyspira hyodysenteriae WA1]KLI42255.1 LexA family transcriptional regulator [Brachyspira hyodysenteriae]KLI44234.1 LexA family transcriptional regulator [Brachyspira hyodysenteriae]KLI56598.1 LexA family transcriptional regulator [Brachyspira hyodysenteriae]MCZ9885611.1 transcriptional repressor LexA [Brachyspira hyodysenteriae]
MTELTDKQRDIFNFLQKFTNENGYPPTVKEIMVHFNFASPTAVTTHLTALEKKGYVKKTGKRARGSVPIDSSGKGNHNMIKIPLLANEVKAGLLMDVADETVEETYSLPKSIAQDENNFLMKVIGDSMINAHIKEGDMVLVHPSNEADNGDIVVAKIDDNGNEEITIKRFFREKDCVKLVSENNNYPPIERESISIVGKVIGLIRLKI